MSQLHKRFTNEQVKVLFQGYCQGQLPRTDLQEVSDRSQWTTGVSFGVNGGRGLTSART